MNEKKNKQECLPELRRITKDLEDSIVEKDGRKEKVSIEKLSNLINKIKDLPFVEK